MLKIVDMTAGPQHWTITLIEANDASQALRLVFQQKPDACVIDIGLPAWMGMNSHESFAGYQKPVIHG